MGQRGKSRVLPCPGKSSRGGIRARAGHPGESVWCPGASGHLLTLAVVELVVGTLERPRWLPLEHSGELMLAKLKK